MKPGLTTVACLCTLGVVAASSITSWRTTRALEEQVRVLQEQRRSLAHEASGRTSAGWPQAGQRSDSPEVLAALIANELQKSAASAVAAASAAPPSPSPPAETRTDPVALTAANDIVDSAFESGHWDHQHQRELDAKLGAAGDDPEAREVMLRVAVGINQGQLKLEPPSALALGNPPVPSH
jgi:uncharacterized membrane protein YebE (DUF533 family)